MNILITGSAGFIGYHVAVKILKTNANVIGIDNVNNYYDTKIKNDRIKKLKKNKKFFFYKIDLSEYKKINNIVKKNNIKIIIHLAAQAGVRHSIYQPRVYFKSNLEGFFNILEISRHNKIKHLIYASTSSVYGNSKKFPLNEEYTTDFPLSFYAATKKSNEVMAHSYSYIYKLPCTGVRFFTVYGPFGRPDMALFKFTKNIMNNKSIELYNHGNHLRDFTYVDDIVDGIFLLIKKKSNEVMAHSYSYIYKLPCTGVRFFTVYGPFGRPDMALFKFTKNIINNQSIELFNNGNHLRDFTYVDDIVDGIYSLIKRHSKKNIPYEIFNIGNGNPKKLKDYLKFIEKKLNSKAKVKKLPLQIGDIFKTHSDIKKLKKYTNYKPKTDIEVGISKFIEWYKDYYRVN